MEMLEAAVAFVNSNMRTAVQINPKAENGQTHPEYPMDAVREVILNAWYTGTIAGTRNLCPFSLLCSPTV